MSESESPAPLTWADYVFGRGAAAGDILEAAAAGGPIRLIMGNGFDPRALHALRCVLHRGLTGSIVLMPLPAGPGRGAGTDLATRNRAELARLIEDNPIDLVEVADIPGSDRLTIGSLLARGLQETGAITATDTVVVDISALPSRLYFPLIGSLLELGKRSGTGELLVTVSESPELDRKIVTDGIADAGPINGFVHGFNADHDSGRIMMWAPVIGERSGPELEAIYELLQQPQEIYPILPFPALDPRRADNLVLEHRELLFDRFEVEPRNILHVDEANAFDAYRTLTNLYRRSKALLSLIGEVQLVVSAHASKMLSTGVCLAAWENRLPVVTASPQSFGIEDDPDASWVLDSSTLCSLWLHGSPYR